MLRIMMLMAIAALLVGAGALSAQEADTTAPAAEAEVAPAPEAAAAAEQQPEHDWEFALSATDKAPGASGTVMVEEAEGTSEFVLVASGLPAINTLDEEGRDVNAYTVWVVPSKDRVAESELAGVLTISPDGTARLEGETSFETFGVIVTATPDGAPAKIGGVPVLTGIPVSAEEAGEVMEEVDEAAEDMEEAGEHLDEAAEEAEEALDEAAEEAAEEVEDAPPAPEPDI